MSRALRTLRVSNQNTILSGVNTATQVCVLCVLYLKTYKTLLIINQ